MWERTRANSSLVRISTVVPYVLVMQNNHFVCKKPLSVLNTWSFFTSDPTAVEEPKSQILAAEMVIHTSVMISSSCQGLHILLAT